ncbi:hypothetical protein Asppvi_000333 [Aspergillus pseudoviridinutans]|uniref:Uncharacterized protein n=1 Tax=Aspergillus pseudoviridinutans TaxID=1517512 RepID=A0A9P3B268_9EURO|nr:uncharacterized protein Asppvi_000333 [Aspergillus pseudoviridinutans]GIJ81830.1 hypothetical protein Asppvi_000333 [Aspergillus pseudoviridinutans]
MKNPTLWPSLQSFLGCSSVPSTTPRRRIPRGQEDLLCLRDRSERQNVRVNCTVLFEGTQNSDLGIPKIQTAKYASTPRLQRVDFERFTDLRTLDFTVTQAGEDDKFGCHVALGQFLGVLLAQLVL